MFGGSRDQFGKAEVQDLQESIFCDDEILGLQVPVYDSGGVRLGESICGLLCNVQHLPGR